MRRMLRILGWLGLGLSTVLFVGTVVVWVRSIGHDETWRIETFVDHPEWTSEFCRGNGTQCRYELEIKHGRLRIAWQRIAPAPDGSPGVEHTRETITPEGARQWFDFVFEPGEIKRGDSRVRIWRIASVGVRCRDGDIVAETGRPFIAQFVICIPFWMLAGVFGLWPLCFAARRMLRRKRYGAGLCPSCGYDLRATPQRCPECGRATASAAVEPKPAP